MNDIKYREPYSVIDQDAETQRGNTALSRQSWNFYPGQSDTKPGPFKYSTPVICEKGGFIPSSLTIYVFSSKLLEKSEHVDVQAESGRARGEKRSLNRGSLGLERRGVCCCSRGPEQWF